MIPGGTQTFRLGDVTITILDVYGIPETLGKLIPAPAEERTAEDEVALARTEELPVQCILVRAPGGSVLVDAGDYEAEFDGAKRVNFNPPDLLERLAAVGVAPGDVEHVVITHAHGDHYNRLTVERAGRLRGRVSQCSLLPRQRRLGRRGSPGQGERGGVAGRSNPRRREPGGPSGRGVGRPRPCPGGKHPGGARRNRRPPGSACPLGRADALLHRRPLPPSRRSRSPELDGTLGHSEANLQSRQSIAEAALAESALLVATHIRGVGRLERTSSGVRWVEVAEVRAPSPFRAQTDRRPPSARPRAPMPAGTACRYSDESG